MADKQSGATDKTKPGAGSTGEAPPISEAADGNTSRLSAGYAPNPDAPGEAIAQVENLKD